MQLIVNPAAQSPLAPVDADRQRELVRNWLAWLDEQVAQTQLAASTVGSYRQGAKAWLAFLEEQARTDRPTSATVGAFVAARVRITKPGSTNAFLAGVKGLYRWAASVDAYPDIARPIRPVRLDHAGPLPCLTHEAVARLAAHIAGDDLTALRDRALLLTMYSTACRCVSLHRADVRHLDLVVGSLVHRPKGHRGHDTTAYLAPVATAACTVYLGARHRRQAVLPTDPLWIATDARCFGARLTTRSMRGRILRLMLLAGHARRGLDGQLVSPGVYSAHCVRRSAVTRAADVHGIEVAQALAVHADVRTTRAAYARANHDRALRAVALTLDIPR